MKLCFARRAIADLSAIADYLSAENPDAARHAR